MNETTYTVSWPEDQCGPEHLAEIIAKIREHTDNPNFFAPISQPGIQKLLNIAFYLSLSPEEGRYPRLCLINEKESDYRLAVKFVDPIELREVSDLRRLAPACPTAGFALLVTEKNDSLWCTGLINIGPLGLNSQPGRPEIVGVGHPPSLRVRIEGPGHLVTGELGSTLELKAGKIRTQTPFWIVPAFREFADQLGNSLFEDVLGYSSDIENASKYFGGRAVFPNQIHWGMARIMRSCVDMGHGGAFVILPSKDQSPSEFDISCEHDAANLDIGRDMVQFWTQCIRASSTESRSDFDKELKEWNRAKARLITNCEAVSNLSAIDGCVVFSNSLQTIGFGGVIGISDDALEGTTRKFRLGKDGKAVSYSEFMKGIGGTRHQSAARLCTKHDKVIVLVISQDRVLRVLGSDPDGYLRIYGPLDPYYLGNDE